MDGDVTWWQQGVILDGGVVRWQRGAATYKKRKSGRVEYTEMGVSTMQDRRTNGMGTLKIIIGGRAANAICYLPTAGVNRLVYSWMAMSPGGNKVYSWTGVPSSGSGVCNVH